MLRSLTFHPAKHLRPTIVLISLAAAVVLARPLAGLVTLNLGVMALHQAVIGNTDAPALDQGTRLLHISNALIPTNAVARNLAFAAFASGDYPAALTYSERAGGPLGNWLAARTYETLGENANALRAYQEAGAVSYLLVRADAANKADDYEAAKRDYLQILELEPDSMKALVGLGEAYWDLGELDPALSTLNAALQRDPRLDHVHALIGVILVRQGQLEPAIEHFLTAAALMPENHQYCTDLANTYKQAGDLNEAARWQARCDAQSD